MKLFLIIVATTMTLAACTQSSVPAPVNTIDIVVEQTEIVKEKPEPIVARPAFHTIQQGETLVNIALNYGLSHGELAEWNGISNPDRIFSGERLRLSAPQNAPVVATVKPQTAAVIVVAPKIKSTLIAAPATDDNDKIAAVAPIKNSPLAAKYLYDKKTLKKLQTQWKKRQSKKQKPLSPPAAPQKIAAKPQTITALQTTAAPKKVRRRFNVDWSWPTKNKVLAKFNEHSKGIDIAGKKGEPIYASANGKVVYTGGGIKSYGQLVVIKHDNDYLTAYAHNDSLLVKEGETVQRGQPIATFGDSGADQVMLHLEIRKAGKPFDPLQVLPAGP